MALVVSFTEFGVNDLALYKRYIRLNEQYGAFVDSSGDAGGRRRIGDSEKGMRVCNSCLGAGFNGSGVDAGFAAVHGDPSLESMRVIDEGHCSAAFGEAELLADSGRDMDGSADLPGHVLESGLERAKGVGIAADSELKESVEGVVRGKNYKRNLARRKKKKMASASWRPGFGPDSGVGSDVEDEDERTRKVALRASIERKWKAQNELAALEAERKLDVLRARDVEQEKRADRARIQCNIEKKMVAIEKTHATLRATGNVPGEMGFCETIIGSGSISPNSSASQAEFRAMKKELEDEKLETAKLRKILERHDIPEIDPDLYDKRTWTINGENMAILDDMYPDGYVLNGDFAPPGKCHLSGFGS